MISLLYVLKTGSISKSDTEKHTSRNIFATKPLRAVEPNA